jgi:hypothetical protein
MSFWLWTLLDEAAPLPFSSVVAMPLHISKAKRLSIRMPVSKTDPALKCVFVYNDQ